MSKYFQIKSTSPKTTTFNCKISVKGKKAVNKNITIAGVLPRAKPEQIKAVNSYVNEAEKNALEQISSFVYFVEEKGFYKIHEIEFELLPEEKQKEYDKEAYARLKTTKAS